MGIMGVIGITQNYRELWAMAAGSTDCHVASVLSKSNDFVVQPIISYITYINK